MVGSVTAAWAKRTDTLAVHVRSEEDETKRCYTFVTVYSRIEDLPVFNPYFSTGRLRPGSESTRIRVTRHPVILVIPAHPRTYTAAPRSEWEEKYMTLSTGTTEGVR